MLESSFLESQPEIPDKDRALSTSTAMQINSPDISPEKILELIEELRTGKFMLHGIKEDRLVPSVMAVGVGNFTPESGNVSCWCTGSSPFGQILPNGKHETYGCTFFHYAHSYTPNLSIYPMTIAVTNYPTLKTQGIPIDRHFRTDSEMNLPLPIPRSAIHMVRIEIPRNSDIWKTNPRALGQTGEAALFKKLAEILPRFIPGSLN